MMMDAEFNVYCDESRHTSDPADHFAVIGAVRCPRERKRELVGVFHKLQARYSTHGEIGWSKVSPNKLAFYEAVLEWFLNEPDLSFRCIVADRSKLDHGRFNGGDAELGFYKLYYQLLVHWITPGNSYHIYLDWQQNSAPGRFATLRDILLRKLSGRARLQCLEPVDSNQADLVQLTDLLIGAVGYLWNRRSGSQAKLAFCQKLCSGLHKPASPFSTAKTETKFNIFHFTGRE